MIPRSYRWKQFGLAFGDLFVFQIALLLALFFRYGTLEPSLLLRHVPSFFFLSLLWCTTFYINHLYSLEPQAALQLLRRYVEAMMVNVALAIALFYLLPLGIEPRTNLFLHFLISLLLGYGWRLIAYRWLVEHQKPLPFAYVGPSEHVSRATELMRTNRFGYTLDIAVLSTTSEHPTPTIPLSSIKDLERALRERQVRGILLYSKFSTDRIARDVVRMAIFLRLPILDVTDLEEGSAGRIPLSSLDDAWLLFHLKEADKTLYERVKRGLDLLYVIPFALLTLLLIPFLALINIVANKGHLFYSQERIGARGKAFRLWKFRTMRMDAETHGAQFSGGTDTDRRITRLGRWMRKTRLDELPQVWNVLRDELSFIGPRPERPEFVEPLLAREPLYALRHLTKPGLTGWAQVQYLKPNQTNEDNLVKLQYDLYYLKHRSFFLDALILLKTVGIVVRREGV